MSGSILQNLKEFDSISNKWLRAVQPPPSAGGLYQRAHIAEADTNFARRFYKLMVRCDDSETVNCLRYRSIENFVILIAHHGAELTFLNELHRLNSKTRGQQPILRRRCSSSLKMA